jgi:hypothetical protein
MKQPVMMDTEEWNVLIHVCRLMLTHTRRWSFRIRREFCICEQLDGGLYETSSMCLLHTI